MTPKTHDCKYSWLQRFMTAQCESMSFFLYVVSATHMTVKTHDCKDSWLPNTYMGSNEPTKRDMDACKTHIDLIALQRPQILTWKKSHLGILGSQLRGLKPLDGTILPWRLRGFVGDTAEGFQEGFHTSFSKGCKSDRFCCRVFSAIMQQY